MAAVLASVALFSAELRSDGVRSNGLRREAMVKTVDVRLGQIFDVTRLPANLAQTAATLPIARFHPGQRSMVLTFPRLAERVDSLMPVLMALFPKEGDDIVVELAPDAGRGADKAPGPGPVHCLEARSTIAAGAVPLVSDFDKADCSATRVSDPLRYDIRQKAMVARREISKGEVIGAPPDFALASIRPGQKLFLQARLGAIAVAREVEALQAARPGAPLFVKDAGQAVFAAQAAETGR